MLEKTTRVNALYDFYQKLLTDKQCKYMEMYYLEDFSLGEIAETCDVSRQAIYDNIRRTEQMLETYETKLGLYHKFIQRHTLLTELQELTNHLENKQINQKIAALIELE